MSTWLKQMVLFLLVVSTACDENQLLSIDKEDTPDSLWFSAMQHINNSEYEQAIEQLALVPDSIKLRRENLVRYSSAYAGFCGLNLLDLLNDTSGTNGMTPILFLMQSFSGVTADKLQACEQAVAIIEDNVSTVATDRNSEENIAVMSYLMITLGLFLNSKFDIDDDKILDPGADSCNAVQLTDTEVAQVGANIIKMFNASLEVSDIEILDEISDDLETGCDQLAGIPAPIDFCNKDDPADYNADDIRGVRSILQEGVDLGMGTCSGSPKDILNCICI